MIHDLTTKNVKVISYLPMAHSGFGCQLRDSDFVLKLLQTRFWCIGRRARVSSTRWGYRLVPVGLPLPPDERLPHVGGYRHHGEAAPELDKHHRQLFFGRRLHANFLLRFTLHSFSRKWMDLFFEPFCQKQTSTILIFRVMSACQAHLVLQWSPSP